MLSNVRFGTLTLLLVVVAAGGCDKSSTNAGSTPATASSGATSAQASAPSASAPAPEVDASVPSKPTGKTVDTPAGVVSEVGDEIHLGGKTLYPPADCPTGGKDGCAKVKALRGSMEGVKLLRHFDGPGGQKSILLFQVTTMGNACNGGPLFFVRLSAAAPPQYSDVFDHCGGPDPMVGAMPDKILINVPAHAPNKGTGMIPAKQMEYDIATGTLQAGAPAAPKKKR